MSGMIDVPAEAYEETDWKKRQEKKRKMIDQLKKKLPKNTVVQEMHGDSEQKRKDESGYWELVDQVSWAARDAYMEEGLSFSEAVGQLKEALDVCVEMCKE